MTCPSCGHENAPAQKFCGECGSALEAGCPSCGHVNPPGQKFCGECGTALAAAPRTTSRAAGASADGSPTAERRLVSVLFADLVGFTTASEGRDAEDTRELLSRYFETARGIVERYGGTVEKFIGDAVMAVWGTPVATEDDAERAVRAALDLVSAIPELDPGLRARAGVLTGEAAVTIGATSEGMVAGDVVNSAARVQSAAEPGTVLVGESTRAAADAAIAFEDAGEHDLKGKAEPMRLWHALRVVANRGGEGRSSGLEAPFVGREREFRLVKDLFQTSADAGHAHLAVISGAAGIGKSRLSWEFEKWIDGLTLNVWWHKGRCLSYGDGVAYWALAEMVRGRAGILENESPAAAREKLHAAVDERVPDAHDREWVKPRLAHLLGLGDATFERDDLFAAWRLFFECLADAGPTVLVFEDLQWADAGLLDFVEYLVEWSRAKPIFVMALARPELFERRPGFGTTARGSFTGLALEPLTDDAMNELLDGLVPGLPEQLRGSIRERADGIPLYAVEIVRMLVNRGQLERADGAYAVSAEIEELEVPQTLHALVASRIDGLEPDERRLVQDASILGKTFVLEALASISRRPTSEIEPQLEGLVRKEILFLESDPRSTARGQYGFLQDLVRHVAYETLARRERKSRHLTAAVFFETSWAGREQEIVEVVASHYVTALELDPDAEDAAELRTKAREALARAGERAASLGASAEAGTLFSRAAGLTEDSLEEARLLTGAGNAARAQGDTGRAGEQLGRAIELYESAGETHAAARVSADLAIGDFASGSLGSAIERLERAYAVLDSDEPDEDVGYLLSQLARWQYFAGQVELCTERNERALDIAERLRLPEVLSHALNTKGLLELRRGHWETARALLRRALEIAVDNDLPGAMMRGYTNLCAVEDQFGNLAEVQELQGSAVELARRTGDREGEWFALGNLTVSYLVTGMWDEIMEVVSELPPGLEAQASVLHSTVAEVARHRGDADLARLSLERVAPFATSASLQDRAMFAGTRSALLYTEGRYDEAVAELEELRRAFESDTGFVWIELSIAEAALAGGRIERAEEALDTEELGHPSAGPLVHAQATRFRAMVAAAKGDERAEEGFKQAAAAFREYGVPFHLACTELEHAEWLVSRGRADEAAPLVAEARETFERLRAAPSLERLDALEARIPLKAAATA
jgi:class 3 adenylate cyclase/tetratricopeptide (TPR) repeat protein